MNLPVFAVFLSFRLFDRCCRSVQPPALSSLLFHSERLRHPERVCHPELHGEPFGKPRGDRKNARGDKGCGIQVDGRNTQSDGEMLFQTFFVCFALFVILSAFCYSERNFCLSEPQARNRRIITVFIPALQARLM